jgi:hypothetical protein
MDTNELVEWQIRDTDGLVMPWWTHPFLAELQTWDNKDKNWLEFGGGRSTAWLRKQAKWVDTIEASTEWANQAKIDCDSNALQNGRMIAKDLPDGIQERKSEFFDLIPTDKQYDIISVDGIWRYECLEWALNHLKGREGIIIADNWHQDFVWISPPAEKLMEDYKINVYIQPNHTNHEGNPWKTVYWKIPA